MGRILRGAAPDVQGLLQADGHQQGWPAGQERPARRLRQRRCPHERVRARRSAGRDLWTLHLRQHVKMFQEKMAGDGNDPDDLIVQAFKAYDNEGKIDSKMFEHALKTWGDKMTKAEIDDIFGEFEIDEDYMIKTKDVIGLFVAVKEEPKVEEPAPLRRPLRPSLRRTPTPRRRRRRRRRPPSKLAAFSTFLPRLWPTLTSRSTLKTPHSKQDTDNMGAEIIQTILSPGI